MYSNDPRSIFYKRVHNKEPINVKELFIFIGIYLILMISIYIFIKNIIFLIIFSLIYILICLKKILLLAIKLYQRVAPEHIRDKCRFEPSCSNYMLQSIEKYGVIKGVKKGLNRLKRCNINDGGYDYP